MHPDREVPGWIWGVCGAAIVAAIIVAWLTPANSAGSPAASAARASASGEGVVSSGLLVRRHSPSVQEFDIRNCLVKPEDLVELMPGRDTIPALDRPAFVRGHDCVSTRPDELVLGVKVGDEARCYPLRLLAWHIVVNDVIAGRPVVVSYDPLSNAGIAADVDLGGGQRLAFGIAGRAYAGEGLLFDRTSNSLWSMLRGKALAGPWAGTKLKPMPVERMTFASWRKEHARTLVLSEDTGYDRPYEDDPFARALIGAEGKPVDYWRDERALIAELPKGLQLGKFRAKELILGVRVNGATKAYPISELARLTGPMQDTVGGHPLNIKYDARGHCATAAPLAPESRLTAIVCFWGAWRAAHPESTVFEAPRKAPDIGADAQV